MFIQFYKRLPVSQCDYIKLTTSSVHLSFLSFKALNLYLP